MPNKGKIIVIEGIDGSGKSAQYQRLCRRLRAENVDYYETVFPRYDQETSSLIRMYLHGEFGSNPSDVNEFAASVFFAVDRYASFMKDWRSIYNNGGLILMDRYTTSNAVHQGAKVPEEKQNAFFDWLSDFEYTKLGLPKPDCVIYLDVDLPTSLRRIQGRRRKLGSDEEDIHENDPTYLEKCIITGGNAAKHFGWTVVDFQKNGIEREIEEKHEEIFSIVKAVIFDDKQSEHK